MRNDILTKKENHHPILRIHVVHVCTLRITFCSCTSTVRALQLLRPELGLSYRFIAYASLLQLMIDFLSTGSVERRYLPSDRAKSNPCFQNHSCTWSPIAPGAHRLRHNIHVCTSSSKEKRERIKIKAIPEWDYCNPRLARKVYSTIYFNYVVSDVVSAEYPPIS